MEPKAIKILWHFKEFVISSFFLWNSCRKSEWKLHTWVEWTCYLFPGATKNHLTQKSVPWCCELERILLSTEFKSSHCNLTIDDRMHFALRQRRRSPASAVFVIIEIDIISRSNENTQKRRRKKLFNKKENNFRSWSAQTHGNTSSCAPSIGTVFVCSHFVVSIFETNLREGKGERQEKQVLGGLGWSWLAATHPSAINLSWLSPAAHAAPIVVFIVLLDEKNWQEQVKLASNMEAIKNICFPTIKSELYRHILQHMDKSYLHLLLMKMKLLHRYLFVQKGSRIAH